ncbi:Glucose-6-phosphate isomerase, cytosolic [Arachis hypogaea]|nr:Glucose-6-phosphate isomerase, cytosolic [Arachis hypogaea]
MRSGMLVLTWDKRCKIAIGAAKGLAYLHEGLHTALFSQQLAPQDAAMHPRSPSRLTNGVATFPLSALSLPLAICHHYPFPLNPLFSTYCSSLYEHYIATRHTMHIYSQVLEKLAPHIQQVSMESNGKGVLIDGVPLPFEAGEIDFGEVGSSHDDSIVDFIRGNMNLEEAAQIPRRTTRSLASSSAQNLLHL